MNYDQALKVITDVCAKFIGNLNDHKVIQEALLVITKKAPEKSEPEN